MGRRARSGVMVAAGLIAAVAPFTAAGPAGATVYVDDQGGSLTFVNSSNQEATCQIGLAADHDTDARVVRVDASVPGWSGPGGSQSCGAGVRFDIVVVYDDEGGVSHRTVSDGYDAAHVEVDHAASGVQITMTTYFDDCNRHLDQPCQLTLTAHPK